MRKSNPSAKYVIKRAFCKMRQKVKRHADHESVKEQQRFGQLEQAARTRIAPKPCE